MISGKPACGRVLFAALVALTGCATTVEPYMAPTPVAFKLERLDLEAQFPDAARSTKVPVFYATTRAPAGEGEAGHYGRAPGESLRLGVAHVALGEPGWSWQDLVASDRTNTVEKVRPGRVEQVDEIGEVKRGSGEGDVERAFVERVNARLSEIRNPQIVVYVHGYKVTFDEVSVLMGSLAHYLGHGAMVTFQWPTGMRPWDYFFDCPRSERYVAEVERLIALLAKTRAQYINIIVYSCGTPLLVEALARLRARHPEEGRDALARRYRIGNVILAAPDIDFGTFVRKYVPPLMDLAGQLTVYFSDRDAPLGWASRFAGGASRLGRPDIEDLTAQDIQRLAADPRFQAIDVTDVRGAHEFGGMRGHGYWFANDWVSTDVVFSLRTPLPPDKRCLVPGGGGSIWNFPLNYERCIEEIVPRALPELRRAP